MSDNQFVRDTCMLIRHDAYHEDGWKRKLATAAAIGAAGIAAYKRRGRIGQGLESAGRSINKKTGTTHGNVLRKTGKYLQQSQSRNKPTPNPASPKLQTGSGGQKFFFKRNGLSV